MKRLQSKKEVFTDKRTVRGLIRDLLLGADLGSFLPQFFYVQVFFCFTIGLFPEL
jgi:hypothetical protein